MESKQKYLIFIILSIAILIRFLNSFTKDRSESKFKINEADLPKRPKDRLSHASTTTKKPTAQPLQLEGFRFDGAAHEILNISKDADEKTIQKAYKELMKRFHPDKVGRSESREWKDAQKIAEKLNLAREEMLARRSQK